MLTHAEHEADVIIIGAGPVGLALACQLTEAGVSCRIIDKRKVRSKNSKALSINAASLKILYKMGIIDRFLNKGEKVRDIYVYWQGKRLMHVDLTRLNSPFPYFLSLPQPQTEKILIERLVELGGRIERNHEVIDVQIENNTVQATLKDHDGNIKISSHRYLIACDGGNSSVRKIVNFSFNGHDYGMHFRLIDVFIDWDGPINDTHYFVKEDGFIIVIPMAGGFHRIVFKDNLQQNPVTKLSLDTYQQLVDHYGPGGIQLKSVIWESSAPFYNRLIEKYDVKRKIFFSGDAAHLFSPIGGLGMNTGLEDVNNLAWKLSGVIKQGWNEKVLDTYNQERNNIASQLIKATDETTRLIARLNKSEHSFENWLPKFKNRNKIRSEYPGQSSGLMQQYEQTDFLKLLNQPADRQPIKVGQHMPYLAEINCCNKLRSSYELIDKMITLLLFVNPKQTDSAHSVKDLATQFGFKYYFIYHNPPSHDELGCKNDCMIIDNNNELCSAFTAQPNDIFLIRPDGYIGAVGCYHQFNEITAYLTKWYDNETR